MTRKCVGCDQEILSGPINKKYCSDACYKVSNGFGGALPGISKGTIGAISELIASQDLMKRGFEVYRALSPASSADLIVVKNKQAVSFEVRTGYRNKIGTLAYAKQKMRADLVCVVVLNPPEEIIYIPKLETIFKN